MKITICKKQPIKLFIPVCAPIRWAIAGFWAKSIFTAFEGWFVSSSARKISNCSSQVVFLIK